MKKSERNGCSNETIHIWPHVGKAKMHLRVSIVSDFFTIFQKKNTYSHTGFDFPDNRSNMHHYSATTISFWLFSNWTPWTFSKFITGPSNSEFLKYSFFKHFLFFWVFYIFTSFQINSWQLLADDSQFTNFEESLQR